MSSLGGKTKKVTVYGRKKSQVIRIHTDISPSRSERPLRTPPLATNQSPASPITTTDRRPPLQAKISHDAANLPSQLTATPSKLKGKGKIVMSSPESEVVLFKPRRVRAVIQSPGSTVPSPPTHRRVGRKVDDTPRRKKEVIVEIPVSTKRRHVARSGTRESSADLADQLQDLSIADRTNPRVPDVTETSLDALLHSCSSTSVQPFSTFLSSPTFCSLLSSSAPAVSAIRKLGEASYSEVFGFLGDGTPEIVVKVIPLLDEALLQPDERTEVELPDCSIPKDVLREIDVTRKMARLPGGGFVDFLGAFVVQGGYPASLLDQWDAYRTDFGSDSIRPDGFNTKQHFALIVLSHGGPDLENFKFNLTSGWLQAAGIFWQVADSVARAEEWARFEHRDLHEGQVLISTQSLSSSSEVEDYLSPATSGVRATIIDFGLSRLEMPETVWTPLPEEVYEGVGAQWDVYRGMRERVRDDWQGFHPFTNVLWLHYLLRRLLHSTKSLRKPRARIVPHPSVPLRPKRRVMAAAPAKRGKPAAAKEDPLPGRNERAHAALVMAEETLAASLGMGRKGTKETIKQLSSARGIVEWANEMSWFR